MIFLEYISKKFFSNVFYVDVLLFLYFFESSFLPRQMSSLVDCQDIFHLLQFRYLC